MKENVFRMLTLRYEDVFEWQFRCCKHGSRYYILAYDKTLNFSIWEYTPQSEFSGSLRIYFCHHTNGCPLLFTSIGANTDMIRMCFRIAGNYLCAWSAKKIYIIDLQSRMICDCDKNIAANIGEDGENNPAYYNVKQTSENSIRLFIDFIDSDKESVQDITIPRILTDCFIELDCQL